MNSYAHVHIDTSGFTDFTRNINRKTENYFIFEKFTLSIFISNIPYYFDHFEAHFDTIISMILPWNRQPLFDKNELIWTFVNYKKIYKYINYGSYEYIVHILSIRPLKMKKKLVVLKHNNNNRRGF
jgi:hypothetical protein